MPSEEELYQEHILDHYEDPFHRGHLAERHARPRGQESPLRRRRADRARRSTTTARSRTSTSTATAASSAKPRPRCCIEEMYGKTVDDIKDVHRRGDAGTLTAATHAEPPEVLPAVVEGAAVRRSTRRRCTTESTSTRHKEHEEDVPSSWSLVPLVERMPFRKPSRIDRTAPAAGPLQRLPDPPRRGRRPISRWRFSTTPPARSGPGRCIDALSGVYERTYANVHRGIHYAQRAEHRAVRRRPAAASSRP